MVHLVMVQISRELTAVTIMSIYATRPMGFWIGYIQNTQYDRINTIL